MSPDGSAVLAAGGRVEVRTAQIEGAGETLRHEQIGESGAEAFPFDPCHVCVQCFLFGADVPSKTWIYG